MPDTPVTKADLEALGGQIAALTTAFETTEKFAQETRVLAKEAKQASTDARQASEAAERATCEANRANRATLGIALALLLLLGFAFYLLDRSHDNRKLIQLQAEYDAAACERGNTQRAGMRQQWTDARQLLLDLGADAETRKLADGLVADAYKNFPALDCSGVREGRTPQQVILPIPPPERPAAGEAKKRPTPAGASR